MKFILGRKLSMTQVFNDDGTVVAVTKIQAGPCQITQTKSVQKDGVFAVQIGFGQARTKTMKKPQLGHLKDLENVKNLRQFKMEQKDVESVKRGDELDINMFDEGDRVSVTGVSKGKGFQGVVKRHGFHGSPASHGHKDQLRMPGSIGATGPQKVFKGTRMGGRMGGDQITVHNLEIVKIFPETNELLIKGAIPGARDGLVMLKADGELKIKTNAVADTEKEVATETTVEVVEDTATVEPDKTTEEKTTDVAELKDEQASSESTKVDTDVVAEKKNETSAEEVKVEKE